MFCVCSAYWAMGFLNAGMLRTVESCEHFVNGVMCKRMSIMPVRSVFVSRGFRVRSWFVVVKRIFKGSWIRIRIKTVLCQGTWQGNGRIWFVLMLVV